MTGAACAPAYDLGTKLCSTNVLFSSMRTIITNLHGGASLVTR
jgi:hypothetical protein